ncbi:unnamed protein product [Fraxinus pennsylvanica]|uniref:Uncharacterized protein n=1 Tax=Fraxinus pennsylvanica TaxID=56036 RepID=A0AAD2E917_9LAMI|nr:unnamed protein product [Fraxinus pennsylvanica]
MFKSSAIRLKPKIDYASENDLKEKIMPRNEKTPKGNSLDTQFIQFGRPEDKLTAMLFGPKYLSEMCHLCTPEDKGMNEEFQRWEIENSGAAIVKEIKDADHMAMISPHGNDLKSP